MAGQVDQRSFFLVVKCCPLCSGKWRKYDGALGYESLTCERCGFDINEIKITAQKKEL